MNPSDPRELPFLVTSEIEIVSDNEKYDPKLEWTLSGDPTTFEESYSKLKEFIESSLDINKFELTTILYPTLVCMYLQLLYNEHSEQAIKFINKFGPEQEPYFQNDLKKLTEINSKDLTKVKILVDSYNMNTFLVPMSGKTWALLKGYLKSEQDTLLYHIVEVYLKFEIYEEAKINEKQIGASNAIVQQAIKQHNNIKINYEIPKVQQTKQIFVMEENKGSERDPWAEPIAKKPKLELSETKSSDVNISPDNYLPSGEVKITDEIENLQELETQVLPSIFKHTIQSEKHNLICASISEDATMLSVGYRENLIQVWSLGTKKLKMIKTLEKLKEVDLNAENVLEMIMDNNSGETVRSLFGHTGPIHSVSFCPDGTHLLSCSKDRSIRLWNLLIWDCVFIYDTIVFPVWDVKFSPANYYFATASTDRTAMLWAIGHKKPLRIFKGHYSDVDCIQFHPNSNYVATGSCDRRILLWDCTTGSNVRVLIGHTSAIYSLMFSLCGRFLVSGGSDLKILIWDIACGHLVKVLDGHENKITALAFSKCGNLLASGSLDCTLKLWDFSKLSEDYRMKNFRTNDFYMLKSYTTKMSPIVALSFTECKILLSINLLQSESN